MRRAEQTEPLYTCIATESMDSAAHNNNINHNVNHTPIRPSSQLNSTYNGSNSVTSQRTYSSSVLLNHTSPVQVIGTKNNNNDNHDNDFTNNTNEKMNYTNEAPSTGEFLRKRSHSVTDLHVSSSASESKNFQVVVRIRPPLTRELEEKAKYRDVTRVTQNNRSLTITEAPFLDFGNPNTNNHNNGNSLNMSIMALDMPTYSFTFDYVYDQASTQEFVYKSSAKTAVLSVLSGYNATCIAYGQTGAGKTFTMEGFAQDSELRGIIPRSVEEIFHFINSTANDQCHFLVRTSFLQIYNEVISDLLQTDRNNLAIREDKKRGVFVEGLSEYVVRSPTEVYQLISKGSSIRATSNTKLNETSSRSHAIVQLIVEQSQIDPETGNKIFKYGKLNLVDLAGSERVRVSGAKGSRLEESKYINQSLSALGNVISALIDGKRSHCPYRDSKLTRILCDSLGGNTRTTFYAMVSPSSENYLETLSTLKFASRASRVTNVVHINEDLDEKALLRRYERELKRLRFELSQKSQSLVDKRKLIETEEKARQAEADKTRALLNLEKLTRDLIAEKQSKIDLEKKIEEMNSKLLTGGHNNTSSSGLSNFEMYETYQYETAQLRSEYEHRVKELEREASQSNKYKQLLLKQRDIMILLTNKLNERDNSILAAQSHIEQLNKQITDYESAIDENQLKFILYEKQIVQLQHQLNQQTNNTNNTKSLEAKINEQADVIAVLQEQNTQLLAQAKQKIFNQSTTHNNQSQLAELQVLKTRVETQRTERSALVVILEKKIKTLIDSIAATALTNIDNTSGNSVINERTRKQITVLQKLVEASVVAIKNAEISENGQIGQIPNYHNDNNTNSLLSSNKPQKTVSFVVDNPVKASISNNFITNNSNELNLNSNLLISKPLNLTVSTPINLKTQLTRPNSAGKRSNLKQTNNNNFTVTTPHTTSNSNPINPTLEMSVEQLIALRKLELQRIHQAQKAIS